MWNFAPTGRKDQEGVETLEEAAVPVDHVQNEDTMFREEFSLVTSWFRRIAKVIDDDLERVWRPVGLSVAQFRVLFNLELEGETTVSGLARLMKVQKPSVSHLVKRLEQEGLLVRRENPQDARETWLTASPQGRAMVRKTLAATAGRTKLEQALKAIGHERRWQLVETLFHLGEALGEGEFGKTLRDTEWDIED